MGRYFVFVHIDTDEQPGVAKAWNVGGIPDIKFTKSDASLVHQFVGYKPLPAFIGEMEKARSMAGS